MQTLACALEGWGNAPAILVAGGGPQLNRAQLKHQVQLLGSALGGAGLKAGDVVSMALPNTVDFVIAFLGATNARHVAAPLNSAYKQDEFKFFMEDAKSKLLIVPEEGNAAAEAAAAELGVPVATFSVQQAVHGKLQQHLVAKSGRLSFQQPMPGQPPVVPLPSDVALFLHTSGTTSKPKGVPLTHANLAASLVNIAATYELSAEDRSYLVMPLFHVHGLMAGLLAPLAAHASVVLPASGKFSAQHFWQDMCEHRCTFYTAVPTIHQILLARADKDYPATSPPPLRFIRSCSSSLAPATLHKLEAVFKVPVLEAYAMTEASHQMTSNPIPKHGSRRPGSVGRAQGSMRVAILDPVSNMLLPPGRIGEVCINGPNVTSGYLNRPEANKEAYAGGWFHTGDQGWLDEEGYLTLTGRIKELINRGGEKISPLEIDGVLLSHSAVAEAVCFGAPDEKYGEVVAAAVVLRQGAAAEGVADDIKRHCAARLAPFKVPTQVFITDALPKGPTGKIQRRFMAAAFIKKDSISNSSAGSLSRAKTSATATDSIGLVRSVTSGSQQEGASSHVNDGYWLVATSLARMGVKFMFGVVGIPVTALASAAQAAGIRFIGMRNEQAAGYAASAAGYLTGTPAVLLTVSGPGAIHGIAGLSHASVNCWPLIMVSGSAEQDEIGKGAFQECDQVAAVEQFCKYAGQASAPADIPGTVRAAYEAAVGGRPGAAYVDVPSNVLMARMEASQGASLLEQLPSGPQVSGTGRGMELPPARTVVPALTAPPGATAPFLQAAGCVGNDGRGGRPRPAADSTQVSAAAALLRSAQRPLVVVGKGAALAGAEREVQGLANRLGLPVLCTAMGRGLLPDSHPLCINAARSAALRGADVALVVGARLNWQLHFGESPKWAADVKFVLVDVSPSERDAAKAQVVLQGDAAVVLQQLHEQLTSAPGASPDNWRPWVQQLSDKAAAAHRSLEVKLARSCQPLDYFTAMRVVRDALGAVRPVPIVVSEGANTMDNARLILTVQEPRTRLDAATWGTMGVGPGYAIGAAVAQPGRLVVAVEGDSAFGFSGMECETIARYNLPVVVIVFNNGGIYGGDRREQYLATAAQAGAQAGGFSTDPAPTDFVPDARYQLIMEAFGGRGYHAGSEAELVQACKVAFTAAAPALINVAIDPMAGVESGNVHAFNAPLPKL